VADGWTIVVEVGKTLTKATLWDDGGKLRARHYRLNPSVAADGYRALDAEGIEQWLLGVFTDFAVRGPVRTIIPVAHGAAAALIRHGELRCLPVDYEWPGAAVDRSSYDKQRDPFMATGSPALPGGLNLGLQLHWLESLRVSDLRTCVIVPWAQYWAWVLSGVAVSEVTSLGCHTDLLRPYHHAPSMLTLRRGWMERLAPIAAAHSVLGELRPSWAARTGLSPNVDVLCGLHDSNAALLAIRSRPDLRGCDTTVLSTGTWFIAMRSVAPNRSMTVDQLPEHRDCLVNVDVDGAPVPSSRFMGGREIDILTRGKPSSASAPSVESAVRAVEANAMALPTGVPGVGPFPNTEPRTAVSTGHDPNVIAQLYVALMADACLDLIGSQDYLVIDGQFSRATVFARALASLRQGMTVLASGNENGIAQGALSLVDSGMSQGPLQTVSPPPVDMTRYRNLWRRGAERLDRLRL
jgi:sugar (pentulose or hexulose) kinase